MTVETLTLSPDRTKKLRGAFFTPPAIASYLARWAVKRADAVVLDPTCGEGIFLLAAGERLRAMGAEATLDEQLHGVDLHEPSLGLTSDLLERYGLDGHLVEADFFSVTAPDELFRGPVPAVDAVIGNPPFVRYHRHSGAARRKSIEAALRQGVRLSGLASSWAALLVHAGAFLKPHGRLAMVLPAELLTVGYAEPVRRWLRGRFSNVNLVLFERLQFADALENVVLLLAEGNGGCDAFKLFYVSDAEDLWSIEPFDGLAASVSADGKWTDLLLTTAQRELFRTVTRNSFTRLDTYGNPELGTVTGANAYFTLTEATRRQFSLREGRDVVAISPPGTRHLRGLSFTKADWTRMRDADERVWILYPKVEEPSGGLQRYLASGERDGVPAAYKCTVRSPWWKPPLVTPPDLFFTYMSHHCPKLVTNTANVSFVNSMHGIRLKAGAPEQAREALPLLALNSLTMLGAEVFGRSYGGGILKMEPREAAMLPMPKPQHLLAAWDALKGRRNALDRALRTGRLSDVVGHIDNVLLGEVLAMSHRERQVLAAALEALRRRRISRDPAQASISIGTDD